MVKQFNSVYNLLQFTWKLPSSVDFRSGAGLVCNYGTAYLALTRKANLQPG
jgi:NADPH:quinone reductase-like Zn-dependent oxidoreductase